MIGGGFYVVRVQVSDFFVVLTVRPRVGFFRCEYSFNFYNEDCSGCAAGYVAGAFPLNLVSPPPPDMRVQRNVSRGSCPEHRTQRIVSAGGVCSVAKECPGMLASLGATGMGD